MAIQETNGTKHKTLAEALAAAQGEFTPVPKLKTATVKIKTGGEYKYNYADFADVLKMAIPLLSKHGIAFTQRMKKDELKLRVSTRLLHAESSELLESDGIAIPENVLPQEFGSYLTYWRRYDGCSLLGIQPDDDEDARKASEGAKKSATKDEKVEPGAGKKLIKTQVAAFWSAVSQSGKTPAEIKAFLKNWKLSSVEEMDKSDFDVAMKWAVGGEPDLTKSLQRSIAIAAVAQHDFNKLFGVANSHGISQDAVREYGHKTYNVASLKQLSQEQFEELLEWVQGGVPAGV